ncbi:N-acetylmuramidase domain-containing protein [Burkholderia glumae]|uniref:N-acetylmuramidase domain-containing protein n=1 Tax=Burkholderia glumae TaxID=337 RepID=UPI002036D92C|nr:N-acetylmuramidase domain-containing protein [Burkholderia glumae]MCM2549394.1 N-acetylmuramidase family protein [Burkholderia glumae]
MNVLHFNDCGAEVGLLQSRLARAGYTVPTTHIYDEATERAVKAVQAAAGLVVDGIAGPKTYATLASGQRNPKHMADADLIAAAGKLGVSVACVRAVNEVEAKGVGFLDDGRPKILFERHIMYRQLTANVSQAAAVDAAKQFPAVVSESAGGYQGGAAEYVRLDTAARIDAASAYASASWGAFQVMGFHWKRLGYSSVDDLPESRPGQDDEPRQKHAGEIRVARPEQGEVRQGGQREGDSSRRAEGRRHDHQGAGQLPRERRG